MIHIFHGRRPFVSCFFPKGCRWSGERRIVKCPNRDPKAGGACLSCPTNSHPTGQAEMMVDTSARVTRPGIYLIRTVQADAFPREIRVAGPRHARPTLAVSAMAHVDHHRLSRDNDTKGATQALGGSRHIRGLLRLVLRSGVRPRLDTQEKPAIRDLGYPAHHPSHERTTAWRSLLTGQHIAPVRVRPVMQRKPRTASQRLQGQPTENLPHLRYGRAHATIEMLRPCKQPAKRCALFRIECRCAHLLNGHVEGAIVRSP
jgi:hypothetical protein